MPQNSITQRKWINPLKTQLTKLPEDETGNLICLITINKIEFIV